MDSVCDLFTVNKQQAAVKKNVTELANDLFRKLKFFDRFTSIWPKFMPHFLSANRNKNVFILMKNIFTTGSSLYCFKIGFLDFQIFLGSE